MRPVSHGWPLWDRLLNRTDFLAKPTPKPVQRRLLLYLCESGEIKKGKLLEWQGLPFSKKLNHLKFLETLVTDAQVPETLRGSRSVPVSVFGGRNLLLSDPAPSGLENILRPV